MATMQQRFQACLNRTRVQDALRLEDGTLADYMQLAQFHYKGHRPGAVTHCYRLVYSSPTVVGRYLSRKGDVTLVGVLVRSLPHLGCQLRDVATGGRYRGISGKASAALVNREVRTISRVVIDPRWRGMGLAVRLVKHALANGETIFTEALAAMGRVHPFFERAGMERYDRPPRTEHARLLDALAHLDIEPTMLAAPSSVMSHLARRETSHQRWLEKELRRWYRSAFRVPIAQCNHLEPGDLLHAARDRLLAQPVYYLFDHRES